MKSWKLFLVVLFGLFALASCATTKPATPVVSAPTTDGTKCTREPVKDWKVTPSPFGGEHKEAAGRMSVMIDVSPVSEDGSGGYLVAIYSVNHSGDSGWTYMYLPPHSTNKPLERFVRCLKGGMEWAYEEWISRPFSYTPAPTPGKPAKKGAK